ncbi:MAG: glycosyltransferase family 9 protein [Elusimicrobia bacterium]|nr:glycosyltransferase family 9 protein [Elusimicrobiota bacterium]
MATAILPPIKAAFPAARIWFWTKRYSAPILKEHPAIDRVVASDPFWMASPGQPPGRFREFVTAIRLLRQERFDAVLVLNAEWRRAFAARWVAPRAVRVGLAQRKSRGFLSQPVALDELQGRHLLDDYQRVAEAFLRKRLPPLVPAWVPTAGQRAFGEATFARLGIGLDTPVVALHPFAGKLIRCWPLTRFRELAWLLWEQKGAVSVLVCNRTERESFLAPDHAFPPRTVVTGGEYTLDQVAALLTRAAVFVGDDSGPAHLAAALGIPSVVLFGPSDPHRFAPRSRSPVKVIQADPLADLPLSRVLAEVETFWRRKGVGTHV